jgi:hypothetical protein
MGVVPEYLVFEKERMTLLGAVHGKAPQSFTIAHFFGGS